MTQRNLSFNSVAQDYDTYRPSYPQKLINDLIETASFDASKAALELGGGTGKATVLLAPIGARILVLEPGPNMAKVASNNLQDFPKCEVEVTTFEDWESEERFDLIFAAQSFHWIQPEAKYRKTSSYLRPQGWLATIANTSDWDVWNTTYKDQRAEIQRVYEKHFPQTRTTQELQAHLKQKLEQKQRDLVSNDHGCYQDLRTFEYPWERRCSSDEYIKLINTYSDNRILEEKHREDFYEDLKHTIDSFGGIVDIPYRSVLMMARVKK